MSHKQGKMGSGWILFGGVLLGLFVGVVSDSLFLSILPSRLGIGTPILAFVIAATLAYFVIRLVMRLKYHARRATIAVPSFLQRSAVRAIQAIRNSLTNPIRAFRETTDSKVMKQAPESGNGAVLSFDSEPFEGETSK